VQLRRKIFNFAAVYQGIITLWSWRNKRSWKLWM